MWVTLNYHLYEHRHKKIDLSTVFRTEKCYIFILPWRIMSSCKYSNIKHCKRSIHYDHVWRLEHQAPSIDISLAIHGYHQGKYFLTLQASLTNGKVQWSQNLLGCIRFRYFPAYWLQITLKEQEEIYYVSAFLELK